MESKGRQASEEACTKRKLQQGVGSQWQPGDTHTPFSTPPNPPKTQLHIHPPSKSAVSASLTRRLMSSTRWRSAAASSSSCTLLSSLPAGRKQWEGKSSGQVGAGQRLEVAVAVHTSCSPPNRKIQGTATPSAFPDLQARGLTAIAVVGTRIAWLICAALCRCTASDQPCCCLGAQLLQILPGVGAGAARAQRAAALLRVIIRLLAVVALCLEATGRGRR